MSIIPKDFCEGSPNFSLPGSSDFSSSDNSFSFNNSRASNCHHSAANNNQASVNTNNNLSNCNNNPVKTDHPHPHHHRPSINNFKNELTVGAVGGGGDQNLLAHSPPAVNLLSPTSPPAAAAPVGMVMNVCLTTTNASSAGMARIKQELGGQHVATAAAAADSLSAKAPTMKQDFRGHGGSSAGGGGDMEDEDIYQSGFAFHDSSESFENIKVSFPAVLLR